MKSAVEFYREELNALVSFRETKFKTEQEIFEQAKEMERQEKNNIYNESYALGLKHGKQMFRGGFDGEDGLIIV